MRKFSYMRFDPEGMTTNPEIPFAKSMPDYIMRWLASRFLDVDVQEELGILTPEVRARKAAQEALLRGDAADSAGGSNGGNGHTGNGHTNGGNGGDASATADPKPAAQALTDEPAGASRRSWSGLDLGPGVRAVRRDDAADGLVLHVHALRQQHRLRVIGRLQTFAWRRPRVSLGCSPSFDPASLPGLVFAPD